MGDAAEVFRDRSSRMPGELQKANDSYQLVADALRTWAESADDTQAQADRGLQQAREAHHDLLNAQAALGAAELSWLTVQAQQLTFQKLVKLYTDVPVPANVNMPTDYQLRSTDRNAHQAQTSIASAQNAIASADARLTAAKSLVVEAKNRRDDAERRAVHAIQEAKGHAVKPSSIWEAIQDSAAWQAIVVIATVVLTIITIVAIFVGGPLVWALIIAATVVLMVNALMSIAQGKDAWGELILLGIGLIPGGRLLGLAAKGVEALARTGEAGLRIANGIASVTGVVLRVGDAVASRVTTVLSSLQRVAEAALPRLTPLVINGAKTAHAALDSFFNPSWLSHFHPGGGVDAVATAGHHAEQGLPSEGSHAVHGSDGPSAHGESTSGGTHTESASGVHEGGGSHTETAGSHDNASSGDTAPAQSGADGSGAGGGSGGAAHLDPDKVEANWRHLPSDEVLPFGPQQDPVFLGNKSQVDGGYSPDALKPGHLESGDRFEGGLNQKTRPDGSMPDDVTHGTYSGYANRPGAAASVGFDPIKVAHHNQIKIDWNRGPRHYLVNFEATTHIDIAEGIVAANRNEPVPPFAPLGKGGFEQIFVPDQIGATHRGEIFPIDIHGNALPYDIEINDVTGHLRMLIYATRPQHLIHLH
ncbi:MAG: hypothetical protein ABJA11_00770 [Pseudolysinimonas sp.]